MGPSKNIDLHARPKFQWDLKSAPSTDGIGDQTEYRQNLRKWKQFPNARPNATGKTYRPQYMLSVLLLGRAKKLCSGITDQQLQSEKWFDLIINDIYKHDDLSVVSKVFKLFTTLLNLSRVGTESKKDFNSAFTQILQINSPTQHASEKAYFVSCSSQTGA